MAVKFIIDSASDVLPGECKKLGAVHVPLTVRFGDKEFADVDYKVRFEDGTEIEFNAKGEWTDVSGNRNCIPTGFILKEITNFVEKNHKDLCITDIERDFNRFTVELNGHLEIEFNNKGKFISYDD